MFSIESKTNSSEENSVKATRFSGTRGDEFFLCLLTVNAALTEKKIAIALTNAGVSAGVNDNALSLIILALGDNSLRATQNCTTSKESMGQALAEVW